MKLYHYTIGIKVGSILESGVIRTSPVKPPYPEKPISWLSSNATYENSALKLGMLGGETMIMTLEQMEQQGQGLYRFVFDTELLDVEVMPWSLLRPRCKAKPKIIKRLLDRAKSAKSSPAEWYGTLDQDLPIATATLEVGVMGNDGKLVWREVSKPTVDASNVLQVTVDEAKAMGLGVECTDETWKAMHGGAQ